MNEEFERIEAVLADVGGYLEYLLSSGALHPCHVMRAEQHEENVGEALRALMEVKRQLGLPMSVEENVEKAA